MKTLLNEASNALSRNDAAELERLCEQIGRDRAEVTRGGMECGMERGMERNGEADRLACQAAMLVFRRQVIAARSNIVLRERLVHARMDDTRSGGARSGNARSGSERAGNDRADMQMAEARPWAR